MTIAILLEDKSTEEMGNNGSQFSNNCSSLTPKDLIVINLAFSGAGAASCFVACVIILLLLISKAYNTVLQRLFFYLMVATAVRELFLGASIEHHFQYRGQETVCTWIAFIYNWTGIVHFVFTVGIIIYLFFLVQRVAKGNTVPQMLQQRNRRVFLEGSYIILTLAITFAYASVPYFTHNYGLAGAWCWIRALDKDCHTTLSGLMAQLFHGHIFYESGGIIGIILMIAVAVVYYRLPVSLQEARVLVKKTFAVIVCFIVTVMVVVFALSIRMITAKITHYKHFAMWLAVGVTYPVSLLLFPVAFLVSFHPFRCGLHTCSKARECVSFFCCNCGYKRKYKVNFQARSPAALSTHVAPSYRESTRVSPPSSTFFHVPYTNGFTHVTTENPPLFPDHSTTDRGYGSISQY